MLPLRTLLCAGWRTLLPPPALAVPGSDDLGTRPQNLESPWWIAARVDAIGSGPRGQGAGFCVSNEDPNCDGRFAVF